MLDGIELKGRCCVVALGIDVEGVMHPLGLWDGSTENAIGAGYRSCLEAAAPPLDSSPAGSGPTGDWSSSRSRIAIPGRLEGPQQRD